MKPITRTSSIGHMTRERQGKTCCVTSAETDLIRRYSFRSKLVTGYEITHRATKTTTWFTSVLKLAHFHFFLRKVMVQRHKKVVNPCESCRNYFSVVVVVACFLMSCSNTCTWHLHQCFFLWKQYVTASSACSLLYDMMIRRYNN